jgi:lysyl-tRNA synthetase class I
MDRMEREPAKKKRARFRDEEDMMLLQLVCKHTPFLTPKGQIGAVWDTIRDELNKDTCMEFTTRACSDRLTCLLKWYDSFCASSAKASGVDEEHTEKMDLLEEIKQLRNDARDNKNKMKDMKDKKNEMLVSSGAEAMIAAETR